MSEIAVTYKGIELDIALAKGYFRMGNEIYTTTHVFHEFYGKHIIYNPIFWLRVNLSKVLETNSTKRIRQRCARFSVNFKQAVITEEVEFLYSQYFATISFDGYPSCKKCIPQLNNDEAVFDTYMIEIRDQDLLIGVGFFDKGSDALMSVLHFYHPEYKRFSIGKYLLLLSIDYAKAQQMSYTYPGYIILSNPKMNYKIFPNKEAIELYLLKENLWDCYLNYTAHDLREYFMKNIAGYDFED
jgi:arginyl-tRNA--protein-N-Asp/Glu arginylyltransferase